MVLSEYLTAVIRRCWCCCFTQSCSGGVQGRMLATIGTCCVEWLPVVAPRFSVVKRKFKSLFGSSWKLHCDRR